MFDMNACMPWNIIQKKLGNIQRIKDIERERKRLEKYWSRRARGLSGCFKAIENSQVAFKGVRGFFL